MGELVLLGRLERAATGATLSPSGSAPKLPFPVPPPPVYGLAIAVEDPSDEVKLSGVLQRMVDEDPSLSVDSNPETGETVLRGQGEMHLRSALERLARVYGLRVKAARPRVPFKQSIRRAVHQHTRLKRQTGGHGQFADVKLDIAPRGRGEGFLFVDRIAGGAVPRQYIPAVAAAAEAACEKGPLGFPVIDVAVTLVDGGFHSVDSSEMAFKSATRIAMLDGLGKADPMLLEPIDHVTLAVPSAFLANAQHLVTARDGRILGYGEKAGWDGWDELTALMPEVELHDLIIELRSQTLGLGTYTTRFDHYAESRRAVPQPG
jgi:elongation factor G